jgi:hypothetical protein
MLCLQSQTEEVASLGPTYRPVLQKYAVLLASVALRIGLVCNCIWSIVFGSALPVFFKCMEGLTTLFGQEGELPVRSA